MKTANETVVMNPNLEIFNFSEKDVRTHTDESGKTWFVAKDVFSVLGITWSGQKGSLESIPKKWFIVFNLKTIKGVRETIFISEPAVYKVAFRSQKEEAEKFTHWVCEEVLPEIRRTGSYGIPSITESISLRNQLYKTMDKLNETENEQDRIIYYSGLVDLCRQLNIPIPDIALRSEPPKHGNYKLGLKVVK